MYVAKKHQSTSINISLHYPPLLSTVQRHRAGKSTLHLYKYLIANSIFKLDGSRGQEWNCFFFYCALSAFLHQLSVCVSLLNHAARSLCILPSSSSFPFSMPLSLSYYQPFLLTVSLGSLLFILPMCSLVKANACCVVFVDMFMISPMLHEKMEVSLNSRLLRL